VAARHVQRYQGLFSSPLAWESSTLRERHPGLATVVAYRLSFRGDLRMCSPAFVGTGIRWRKSTCFRQVSQGILTWVMISIQTPRRTRLTTHPAEGFPLDIRNAITPQYVPLVFPLFVNHLNLSGKCGNCIRQMAHWGPFGIGTTTQSPYPAIQDR